MGAWLPAKLTDTPAARVAHAGAALVALGLFGLGAVLATGVPVVLAHVAWAVAGFGAGMGFTTNSASVLDNASNHTDRASSQMELGNCLGIALGTGLGGLLIGSASSPATGIVTAFVLAALAALTALATATRISSREEAVA